MSRPITIGIAGAHSGAGKTTLASLLLGRLEGWGAIKYSRTDLYCSLTDELEVLSTENKDTKRLLDAGAARVQWVQSPPSELKEILPLAIDRLSDLKGIIIEGNSAIEFLKPDIIIFMFGVNPSILKESARGIPGKADMLVYAGGGDISRNDYSLLNADELLGRVEEKIKKEEDLRDMLKKSAIDGRLQCPLARKIAEELGTSYKRVGKAADELKIKITDCELGCF